MSNPTSNFGWVMPTNTDLVTDLPADFAVFGQAVDTSMADLKGGTTGQILSKATSADMDFTWIANDQGDITGVTAGTGISGGGTSGTVTVSIDTAVTADLTTAQTFTNKKLSDSTTSIVDVTDATKAVKFDVGGTTAITGTIATNFTTAKTITIPDATDTLVGRATTDTLTNKTLTSPALTTPTISTATTNGDLLYGTGSGALTRLGIGSSAQVLTVASGVPSWATPAGGGSMTLINTGGTALTGATVSVGSIPSTYQSLYISVVNFKPATNNGYLCMRLNGDAGANRHYYSVANASQASYNSTRLAISYGQNNGGSYSTIVSEIPNYANGTIWKNVIGFSLEQDATTITDLDTYQWYGAYNQLTAISSLDFFVNTGNLTSGTVYVYGVK